MASQGDMSGFAPGSKALILAIKLAILVILCAIASALVCGTIAITTTAITTAIITAAITTTGIITMAIITMAIITTAITTAATITTAITTMATKLTALQHAESVSHPEAIFAFQKANAFREQLLIARVHMIISQVIAGSLCMGILRASSTRWFALEV